MDLFVRLIALIRKDNSGRAPLRTRIILLGDMVDRGPQVAPLIEALRANAVRRDNLVVLRGNHEDIMLAALRGDLPALGHWLKFGGDATLRSWGMRSTQLTAPLPEILAVARRLIPSAVIRWLRRLPLSFRSRDFLFVHAGIRPGVALEDQESDDLLWIGRDFLDCAEDHPAIIVHGHSITEQGPEFRANRIALDTGAFRTGRLAAVGFEGNRQWVLST